MSGTYQIVVRQVQSHRRSEAGTKKAARYLGSTGRGSPFGLSVRVEEPVRHESGYAWVHRAVLVYAVEDEGGRYDLEREWSRQLERVKKACTHARWGDEERNTWWHIEGTAYYPAAHGLTNGDTRSDNVADERGSRAIISTGLVGNQGDGDATEHGKQQPRVGGSPRSARFTDPEIREIANAFALAGEPTRLKVLIKLKAQPTDVSSLVADTGQTQPNISAHLAKLRNGGMVVAKRDGQRVIYHITDRARALTALAERLF